MITTNYANQILNTLFLTGGTGLTAPTTIYLGLSSTKPSADGSGITEPTATSYKRVLVAGTDTANSTTVKRFDKASGGIVQNKEEIQCATAREEWGVLPYWFLSTSSSKSSAASTIILWGELTGAIATDGVAAETVPVFYEGELKASIDVELTETGTETTEE